MLIDLGTNKFEDCGSAVILGGVEVFKLRSGASNDQVLVDFEIRDHNDNRIAKISKNQVVHTAPGYTFETGFKFAVVKGPSGNPIAQVTATGIDSVAVTGVFWVNGRCLEVYSERMIVNTNTFMGCHIRGNKIALQFD